MKKLTKTEKDACVENGAVPIPLFLLSLYPWLLKFAMETTTSETSTNGRHCRS
jgi:hypothetical protein